MLYLEDYIEMIEHLPRELRDGFTELREIDLQVHNSADTLEERVKTFFSNARKMKPHEREAEYETIRKGHYKSLEDCDEKVQIAHQMYDLVDRHLRRLDQELHKFKMELEADNAGITEELERRSLEMDSSGGGAAAVDCQKENRYGSSHGGAAVSSSRRNHERKPVLTSTQAAAAASRRDDRSSTLLSSVSTGTAGASSRHPSAAGGYHQLQHVASSSASSSCSSSTYSGGGINPAGVPGGGSNALAAAASQAIAATQHMQQGRRTTAGGGVRSSYDSCSASELSVARELAGAAHAALASSGLAGNEKRKRKSNIASTPVPPISTASPTPSDEQLVGDMIIDPSGEEPWLYDANEPRYCVCQNVSYGDMVACDNRECPYEWFHYACVGITAPPKGKWYCPQCSVSMKRRRQK